MSLQWYVFMRSYLRESSEILQDETIGARLLPFIFIHRIKRNQKTDHTPNVLPELLELLNMCDLGYE